MDNLPMSARSVVLATKMDSREAGKLAGKIRTWLEHRSVRVYTVNYPYQIPEEEIRKNPPDLIIVLGGDGTILSVVRAMLFHKAPFVGVNLGKVGFLAEISPSTWEEQLSLIFSSVFKVSRRLLLEFVIISGGREIVSGVSVNELVVSRGKMARLISMDLESSQGTLKCIRADGMIFSTPTGSTAYCVSAGGPLVHPETQGIILAPICVFLHDFKPLVMPAAETFQVSICSDSPAAFLTVDGQTSYSLNPGDLLRVSRYHEDLKLLMCEEEGFISKLRAKRFFTRG